MVTRSQVGTVKPNHCFHGHTSYISHIYPISSIHKSSSVALSDPNWRDPMYDEYNALIKTILGYKARLVANGRSEQFGVDCDDTFSHVVKSDTIRGLQYLTFTRPDISYAVQQVCLHMHDLLEPYLAALKRVIRYVHGTLDFGLQLYASITGSFVAYTDADWAGCPTTRRSTSGYCVFLRDNLLSCSAKRQYTLSRSSAEADFFIIAVQTAGSGIFILLAVGTPSTGSGNLYCQFKKAIFKKREEINDMMAEMFRLLRELTSSKTPEKVLVREEANNPVTKNINAISLIKIEKENGIEGDKVTKGNVMKLNELEALEPIESPDKEEEREEQTNGR
nr:ribonuclease H-like domain-containing protein [Tanacetum cinerariifolium]